MKGSLPYIMMTLRIMEHFGIATVIDGNRILVREQSYKFKKPTIEPDWSSAAFWYELAAFSDKADIVLEGLTKDSVQGDAVLHRIFDGFGVNTEFIEAGAHLTRHKKRVGQFELRSLRLSRSSLTSYQYLHRAEYSFSYFWFGNPSVQRI
jgi:5-enolpyruvylshikimate-3-phosphate synthase